MKTPDWNRLLLAYADGVLNPVERAHVERYLAANPCARDLLADLEEIGPGNFDLWDIVEPPVPSDDDWDRTSQMISIMLPRPRRRWPKVVAATLAACAAAVVAVIMMVPDAPPAVARIDPPKAVAAADPLAEFAVLPMATRDDVMVSAVRGNAESGLVSVRSPLSDVLALATTDDVEIDAAGGAELAGGDAAMMIWPKK